MDAGDLFFKSLQVSGIQEEIGALKAKTVVEGFNIIGCDVFNVGRNDFANGSDFLMSLSDSAQFPFISANIINEESGKLVFEPYKIVERGNLKFGILGLVTGLPNHVADYSLLNFLEEGKRYLEELTKKTDYQVVLLNGTSNDGKAAEKEFASADFLFLSQDKRKSSQKLKTPDSGPTIFNLGKQGRSLALLELNVVNVDSAINNITNIKSNIKYLEKRLKNLGKRNPNIPLKELYKNNPKVLKKIERMQSDLSASRNQLGDKRNTVEFTFKSMNKNIPGDPVVLEMVNKTLSDCKNLEKKVKKPDIRNSAPSIPKKVK